MPIEIRELLIRTTIESTDPTKKPETGDGEKKKESEPPAIPKNNKMKEQLVKECINAIMDNFSAFNKER